MSERRRWLTAARALMGKTLDDVYEDTGIPKSTMSSYECGTRNIPKDNAEKLSPYLNLPLNKFREGA